MGHTAGQSRGQMHGRSLLLISGVRNDEVRRLTGQPKLTAIVQSRHPTLFGHIARMEDDTDAKRILLILPLEDGRPRGRPCITWLSTIQQDLRSHNLTLPEAVDMA